MRTPDDTLMGKRFAAIEALLIHRGSCSVKDCAALFGLTYAAAQKVRFQFIQMRPEAVAPDPLGQRRCSASPIPWEPKYLPSTPQSRAEDARHYLQAMDVIHGTSFADVKARGSRPRIAPIVVTLKNGVHHFVYVEDARTLRQPELHEFKPEELRVISQFPDGCRMAIKTEERRRTLICIGKWNGEPME